MVDVSGKAVTAREAVARGMITMSREALRLIRAGTIKKGDPLQTARLAGIMAAKQTAVLIPLCHPLSLSHIDVTLTPVRDGYTIESRVRTTERTGVEMEALTAVAVAALTIYDMVKAVDKAMVIGDIKLVEKRGGRSGEYPGVTILISIHSPFEIWTIPPSYVDRLRARFPSHTFLHARSEDEALSDVPRRGGRLRGADYSRAAGGGAAPPVAAQPGGGRRRHAVSRDGRRTGRYHELAGNVGGHHRGACARRHARALPAAAARVPEPGGGRVGPGRDRRRRATG